MWKQRISGFLDSDGTGNSSKKSGCAQARGSSPWKTQGEGSEAACSGV